MKIGVFADPHYCMADRRCGTRRPILSLGKIREAMGAFREAKVDLCICMGDLVDRGETPEEPIRCLSEAMELIRGSGIPYRIIPGNHDAALFSNTDFLQRVESPAIPCVMETATHTLIFLDANFRSDFRSFYEEGVDWKDSNLPPDQIAFLKDALDHATKPCVVLLHENLDPNVQIDHIVKNAAVARKIIAESGKVSLVLQGHYHRGCDSIVDGIRYLTLTAMCEGEDNHYMIFEI